MIYTLFFLFLLLGAILNWRYKANVFLLFVFLFLWSIIGFRSLNVGEDTPSYVINFELTRILNFGQLCNRLSEEKEPLYLFITWFASCISNSYIVYLLLWALFPCVALYFTIRDYLYQSRDYVIAILVLFLIGFYAFFVAGIRQTAALSVLMFSYRYFNKIENYTSLKILMNKNLFAFLLCLFLAYMIHNSSILFLLVLPFRFIKMRWWYIFIALGSFILGKYVKIDIITQLSVAFFQDRFSTYGDSYVSELSMSGYFMQMILFLICYIKREVLIKQDPENNFLFNMMLLGLVFQSLTGLIGEMYRVSFYFSIFDLILVPRAMRCYDIEDRNVNFVYFPFIALSLYYLFSISSSNMPEYSSSLSL